MKHNVLTLCFFLITVLIGDTVVYTTPLPVEDTTLLPVEDTTLLPVEDTTLLPVEDTTSLSVEDTTPLPVEDTTPLPVEDTTLSSLESVEVDDQMDIFQKFTEGTGKTEEEVVAEIQQIFKYEAIFSEKTRNFSMTCETCISRGKYLVLLIKNVPKNTFIKTLEKICVNILESDPSVCEGTIRPQADILIHIVGKIDIMPKIKELCSSFLKKDCDGSKGTDWLVPLPNITKPLVEPIPRPHIGKPTMKILQISDVHLDPIYEAGATAECNKPICCRDGVIGPPGNGIKGDAGLWGSYKCDASVALVWDMLKHISENHQDIDYAFLIGDNNNHGFWSENKDLALKNMALTNDFIRNGLPGVQVYPIIGNHDTYPVNNFPPKDKELQSHELFNISWLLKATWDDWTKKWLPRELKNDTDLYYSLEIVPGLKLIALNSNYFYVLNWWNMYSNDTNGQLAWFVQQLQMSEDKGEKVQVLMHQPPGTEAYKTYSHNFWRIIQRYESTIRGIFAGHTHADEFQLMFDDEDPARAISVVYLGPSVTTFTNLSPAYRIYTIDGNYEGSSYAILDFEDYYVDLTEANLKDRPTYKKLYSPKEAYGMVNLNPQSWKEVVDRFESDEDLFQTYYTFWHRKSPTQPKCDASCRRDHICFIVMADASNYRHCNKVPHF